MFASLDTQEKEYKIFNYYQYIRVKNLKEAGYNWMIPNYSGTAMFWKKEPKTRKAFLTPDLSIPYFDIIKERPKYINHSILNLDDLLKSYDERKSKIFKLIDKYFK